jgi:predicted O-methyltransferase YrrM
MNAKVLSVLKEIYDFGAINDSHNTLKEAKMRNITPITGELLHFFVGLTGAKRVLEIGTSNGYSTIWIAAALVESYGRVTTLEFDANKAELAQENFSKSGLEFVIDLVIEDAGDYISNREDGEFDFIFMDSDRIEYSTWWPHIQRIVKVGGLIIVDNASSHSEQIQPFYEVVKDSEKIRQVIIPAEQGLLLIQKIL